MKPYRVQLSRRRGWRMPPNTTNVSRPTRYGNPHRIGLCPECGVEHSREEAIAEFRALVSEMSASDFEPLRGKNLACSCALDVSCHADVLLELANRGGDEFEVIE